MEIHEEVKARAFVEAAQPLIRLVEPGTRDLVVNEGGAVWIQTGAGWRPVGAVAPGMVEQIARRFATLTSTSHLDVVVSGDDPATGYRMEYVLAPAVATTVAAWRIPGTEDPDFDALVGRGLTLGANELGAARPERKEIPRQEIEAFLRRAVQHRLTVLISGGTGAGKTTVSRALMGLISDSERLVVIEDARELRPRQPNVVTLRYGGKDGAGKPITAGSLLRAALRLIPERIILGELRGAEAWQYLKAIDSGHPGSITTIHASSPLSAVNQLIRYIREAPEGQTYPPEDLRRFVEATVDVVVQLDKRTQRIATVWCPGDAPG